jgi:hypothetical protein
MSQVCQASLDASNALVSLVIDVIPDVTTADHWKNNTGALAKLVEEIVKSPEFQQQVKSKLSAYAKSVMESTTGGDPPKSSGTESGKKSGKTEGSPDDNPVVQAAKSGLQDVGLKIVKTCTAPGIFYNQNEKKIMIVGTIVAIAGAFAVWKLRSDAASSLLEGKDFDKEFKAKLIGSVKVSGKIVKFTPTSQETQSAVSVKWNKSWNQYISTEIGLTGTIRTQKAEWITTADKGDAAIRVRLNDVMTITGGGSANFANGNRDMFLNFQLSDDNVSIGLEYRATKENRPSYKHDVMFLFKKDF